MEKNTNKKARLIAYYLPLFHSIPENDEHWGVGFTEWTNVAKAKQLYKGHYQPFLPTYLGYYDLRLAETRKAQADMAREYGIEGFCYWHYWFGNGKRVLETPFNEVVKSGEPNFPFSLRWANHSWTAIWVGDTKTVILEQVYAGVDDYTKHFNELLTSFKDDRYIKVDGKLLFSIFAPKAITNYKEFTDTWRKPSSEAGLPGFYFVGMGVEKGDLNELGLDAFTPYAPHSLVFKLPIKLKDKFTYNLFRKSYIEFKPKVLKVPRVYDYKDVVELAQKQKYAVVTKDVPANTVAGGIPAKIIKILK